MSGNYPVVCGRTSSNLSTVLKEKTLLPDRSDLSLLQNSLVLFCGSHSQPFVQNLWVSLR